MSNSARSSRRIPFLVLFFFIFIVGAYTAYWFYAANQIKIAAADWISDQKTEGYVIEHGGLKVSGYPTRFHVDIVSPHVIAPDNEWAWQAEKLALVMQTYNYRHVIGYAPGHHEISTPDGETYTADAIELQASASWNKSGVKRISVIAADLAATLDDGRAYNLNQPFIHLSPMPEAPQDLRIIVGFEQLSLPEPIEDAELFGTIVGPLSAPIAITNGMTLLNTGGNMEKQVQLLQPIVISPLTEFNWGPLELKAKTDGVTLDPANRPQGVVELRVENIGAIRQALTDIGKMDDNTNSVLTLAEKFMSDGAFLPITLKDGKAMLGFQKIGTVDPVF